MSIALCIKYYREKKKKKKKMGSWLSKSDHDNDVDLNIESVSRSEDMIFKSKMLSAPIKENNTEVKRGFDEFSKNETNMKLLSRQATAVSKKDLMNTLTKWKEDLELHLHGNYDDLNEVFDVAETNHWPQHLSDQDSLWETTQQPVAKKTWLYFYVSRTDANSDAQKFNVAICHFISNKIDISRDVLIGGLCKKGFLLKDDDDNIYLNFPRSA